MAGAAVITGSRFMKMAVRLAPSRAMPCIQSQGGGAEVRDPRIEDEPGGAAIRQCRPPADRRSEEQEAAEHLAVGMDQLSRPRSQRLSSTL